MLLFDPCARATRATQSVIPLHTFLPLVSPPHLKPRASGDSARLSRRSVTRPASGARKQFGLNPGGDEVVLISRGLRLFLRRHFVGLKVLHHLCDNLLVAHHRASV